MRNDQQYTKTTYARIGLLAITTVALIKAVIPMWAWSNENGWIDPFPPDEWGPVETWIYLGVAGAAVAVEKLLAWVERRRERRRKVRPRVAYEDCLAATEPPPPQP